MTDSELGNIKIFIYVPGSILLEAVGPEMVAQDDVLQYLLIKHTHKPLKLTAGRKNNIINFISVISSSFLWMDIPLQSKGFLEMCFSVRDGGGVVQSNDRWIMRRRRNQ